MKLEFYLSCLTCAHAFVAFPRKSNVMISKSNTRLQAIGVLARKAKKAEVRKYCEDGVEENVLEEYKKMKSRLEEGSPLEESAVLQEALTRRKGTISVIAEYKRKMIDSGYIDEVFDPEILGPSFREYGATAISVMADNRMGGCDYNDIARFVEEQRRARNEVPGSLFVINHDLIVDEIQVARTKAYGAHAVVLNMQLLSQDLEELLKASRACELEAVVTVATAQEAQSAVDMGARVLLVTGVNGAKEKYEIVKDLKIPDSQRVCLIADILTRANKELEEIEEAWACRDVGFNAVWISEALYKGGSNAAEHPGAIIQTVKAKSSTKWASPKARSGKGEGAREYLGDIMM